MQITHEEARRLIQMNSDEGLKTDQKTLLDGHLEICSECQNYAHSIHQMEALLRPLMQRQWNQQPTPLSIGLLISKINSKFPDGALLTTRIAAASVMFVVFMFSVWQFTVSKPHASGPMTVNVPSIPVPSTSTQSSSTQIESQNCSELTYLVQENDTLESIAVQFSTSKARIFESNHLQTGTIHAGMKLMIPLCNSTPTGTVSTSTITFTPILGPITATPGG